MAKKGGFPGMPGGANMNQLMQQAQKMQRDMQKAQEEVEALLITASAGGDAVSITINGKHEVTELVIKPEVVDPDDVEMLQDLIVAAINQAETQLAEATEEKMGRFSGLGL